MNWFVQPSRELHDRAFGHSLTIGLLNNIAGRASGKTENQFLDLVRAACPGADLRLEYFTCPGVQPRGSPEHRYAPIDKLFDTHLDALIVTGMEPQAQRLQDEPIWNSLTRVADWAQDNAVPVLWSCLAAHAAVLHLDGINRFRLREKLSGLFECECVSPEHPLMAGLAQRWVNPHSRYHDLPEEALLAKGYQILSKSCQAGVDIFLKRGSATSIFFQGHPEYMADSIRLEYRRDIQRYRAGGGNEYPATPRNYFDDNLTAQLDRLRGLATSGLHEDVAPIETSRLIAGVRHDESWRPAALRLYRNFLYQLLQDPVCVPVPEPLMLNAGVLAP